MRILHIVNDAQTGGAQTLIEAMCRSRVPGDEHHIIVLMSRGALSTRLELVADGVHHVGLRRSDLLPFRAISMVRRVAAKHDIDVIHTHLLQSDLVALLSRTRIPVLSTLHTSGSHESRPLAKLVGWSVARLSVRFNAVVACSASAREYARTSGYAQAGKTPVIHNGTTVQPAYPEPYPPKEGEPIRLLQLARWHPMKDHRNLFRALALVRSRGLEVEVHCAGQGMDRENAQLGSLLEETGVTEAVHLHGSVRNVAPLFDRCAAMTISSSHGEALPMAGLESLAAGIPVLTTDVGDCSILAVDPELLVPPSNPETLAEAIATLHGCSPAHWKALSRASWERAAADFEEGATSRAYRREYLTLVGSHSAGPVRSR